MYEHLSSHLSCMSCGCKNFSPRLRPPSHIRCPSWVFSLRNPYGSFCGESLPPPQAFWKSSTSVCVLNFLLEAPSIFPFQNTLTPDAASFHLYRGRPWKLRARLRPHLRQCRIFNSLDAYSTSLIFRATTIVSFREVYEILHCLWCIPHFLTSSRRFRYTFSPHKSI